MNTKTTIIALASDHAGFELKEQIKHQLTELQLEVKDFGSHTNESVDYPDLIHPLAAAVDQGIYTQGIIICGSGNGVSMTANKYAGVRAALCWNEEIVRLARAHNDANVLALPARFVDIKLAREMVNTFLNTAFEGGRHLRRKEKICPGL